MVAATHGCPQQATPDGPLHPVKRHDVTSGVHPIAGRSAACHVAPMADKDPPRAFRREDRRPLWALRTQRFADRERASDREKASDDRLGLYEHRGRKISCTATTTSISLGNRVTGHEFAMADIQTKLHREVWTRSRGHHLSKRDLWTPCCSKSDSTSP